MRAVALGVMLVACQADPPAREAAETAREAAEPARETAEPARTATGSASGSASHLRLPRSAPTPPRRTTRPLTRDQLARLAAIEHHGFERADRGAAEHMIEFRHTTRARPTLGVTLQIAQCDPASCPAMTLDAWAGRRDELARALPPELAGHADTRLELGARALPGAIAISAYQLGAALTDDAHGQPIGAYVNAYSLDYNDRVNRMRVTVSYLDDAVGGVDRLIAIAPPEDLEKLAVAFLSFYLHHW
jgi:hypothetical protein